MRRFRGRRRYRGFRGKRRTGGFFNKAGKALAIAGGALAVAKQVKSLINVEFKQYTDETSIAQDDVTTTGSVYYLNSMAQGDGESDRDGDQVKMKRITGHGRIDYNSAGNIANQTIRLILFRDHDYRGGNSPTVATGTNSILSTADVFAFRHLDNVSRYKVLFDKTYVVNSQNPTKLVSFTKALNHKLRFNGALGANGTEGTLWLMTLSNQGTADFPELWLSWRLRYIDN